MSQDLKIIIKNLIKEGVPIDVILRSTNISLRELMTIDPVLYGMHLGEKKAQENMFNAMVELGLDHKVIMQVTSMARSNIKKSAEKKTDKNK